MSRLGLDIGGASLKAADNNGWAASQPFALWRQPEQLAAALAELLSHAPAADRIAVAMTGELCDCFRTKSEGVLHILNAVEAAAPHARIFVYLASGTFVPLASARQSPELAAASNWHALAAVAAQSIDQSVAVLIDVGSTTTDIIPLASGRVGTDSTTDIQRLERGELVYTGMRRTPICAVVDSLPWNGGQCPIAAELFATTADAYVLLGDIGEEPDANDTADGRPLTHEFAHERLARMLCADRTQFSRDNAIAAARAVRDSQLRQLQAPLQQVIARSSSPASCFVVSGSGEFLASRLVQAAFPAAAVISLAERLGPAVSACAPAHAVAVLAEKHGIFR